MSAIGVALALAATAAPAHGAATPALPLGFEPLGAGHFGARAPGGAATIAPGAAIVAGRHTAPVRLRPVGAHRPARTKAGRRLPGVVNRLTGDRSSWRTGIPMYADVRQNGIYRGIDLVFHTRKGALEYDFIVRPGASPRRVRLAVDGARRLRLSRSGDLVIRTRGGTLRQRRPVAYQRIGGRRKAVRARFVLRGKRRVAFRVGAYDRSRTLVIDPVFAFSGYLGGSGYDEGYDVTTDTAGNAYVVGRTASFDFPALAGADVGCGTDPAGSCNADTDYDEGRGDAFVAKLDPLGRLVWVTYIGGSTHDQAQEIALDPSGRIVVSGLTASRDFPVTAGAYRTTWPTCDYECWSTYVLRLAPDGRSLDWSTLFASDTFDTDIEDLTVDAQGDVVLVGNTETSTFPKTLGTLGAAARSLPDFWGDAFVTKLDSSGATLEWSGAFGGDDEDGAASVAIAPGGDIVIGGRTGSPDFFTTPGAPQPQCDGPRQPPNYEGCEMDGFVMRVPASGATPTYSTFLGGDGWDQISALALDADGRPLVAGRTTADDFPATRVLTLSPYERVFAARLPAAGGPPEWASLVAGGFSYVTGVAPGGSGSVYVSGSTYNADAVRPVSAYQSTHNGGLDGFVMRVNSGGASTRWATYLGGRGYDAVNGLAAGPKGVVVAGTTTSGDYPTRAADAALGDGTCRSPYGCPADAFVARITEATSTPPAYDAFSRRRVLEDAAGYAYGDATSATAEPGEPAHAGQPATHSLWFEWTAPANRTVTFDTRNSGFDTVVAVYRGKSFSLLTPVATNDNAPGRLTSRVSFTAVRGRTYRIAVDGKAGAAGLARLEWNGAPPANDDFLAAQPVTGTSGSVTGSVAYATMETDEPPDSDGDPVNSIWYRWTAPASGVYRLSTSGSDMPAEVEVFHGQRVELLEHLAWDILTARAGETYWFRVHPYNALAGDVKLSWRRVPRPANDDLAGARALTSESGTTTGETYAATAENDEPVHGTPSGGHSVWFRLAPPTPGTYELTLENPDYGYSLYVYDGSSYATLVGISGGSRLVRLGFEAGESVLVAIDLFGEYRLSWRRLDAPANDLFSQAQVLAPGGGDEPVVTRNSSTQLGEPGGYTGVWFRWTAPSAGPVTFEVLDEVSAQGLNVFTGSSIRALTPVGFSDPYRAKVTFDATAGTTYRIRLAGGDVVRPLAWAIGRPANDDFGAARALTGANGTTSFSMAHATTEAGEPGNQWEGSAWFTWTAPSTARATFTTAAGRADLPIDIFTGNQLTALTAVAGSSYDQAVRGYVASFDAVAGRTYRIRVRGAWLGTQELTWNRAASESEAPFVAFAYYPSPGDHLRGRAYLEAITFDRRGVDRVEFLAGGTVVATSTLGYQGRFSANWDTTTRADGAVTMTARAVDRFGNVGLSAPVDVVVDNTAPQTQILSGPSAATASRSAKFTFSAGESVKEWWCRLDQYAWLPCGSTLTVTKLSDGLHKLEVRAKDFAGNLDVTPARWVWSVTGAEAQPIAGASTVQTAARSAIALDREGRLQLAVALPQTRVTAERLRRGLHVATGCSRACTIRARLQLLGARSRTLAGTRLRARPGRKATVRLRVKRSLPAEARLQLVVSAGTASVRRPLALDRPR